MARHVSAQLHSWSSDRDSLIIPLMPRSCASMALGLPGAAAIRVIGFENQNLDGIYVRDKTREIRNHPVFIQGATRAGTPSTAEGVHLMCLDARRCWWCVQFLRTSWSLFQKHLYHWRGRDFVIFNPFWGKWEVPKGPDPNPYPANLWGFKIPSSPAWHQQQGFESMKPSSNIMAW